MYNLYHPSSSSIPAHNAMSPQASVSPQQQQQQQQQQQPHLFFTSPPPSSLSTAGEPLSQGQTYTLYRLTPAPPQPHQQQHPVQITSPFVSSADPQWLAWQPVRHSAASSAGPSLHHLMASSGGDTADLSVASGSYASALLPAPPPASSGAATSTSYATAFIASADPPHPYGSPTAFTPLYLTGVADSRRTSYNVSSGTHHVDSSTDSAALYHALPPCPPLPPAQQQQQQQYGPAPRQRLVSLDGVPLRTPPPHSLSLPTQSAKESTLEPSTTFLHTLGLALAQSTAPAVSQPGPAPHLAHPSGASHGMRAAGNVQLATASPMYTTSSTRHVDASAEEARRPFPSAYAAFVEGGDVDAHQRHVHHHQHPPQQQQQQQQRASLTSQNISTADYTRPFLPRWERANSSSGALNAFSNRPSLTSASLPSRRPTRVSMTSLNSAVLTNSVNDSRVPPAPSHHRDSGSTVGHAARVRPLLPFEGEDTKRQPPHHSRHQHLPVYQQQPQQPQPQQQHQFAIAATHSRESSLSNVSPPQTPSKGVARRNRDKAVLFVGQLNYEATEADVTQVFACYGKPLSVVVLKDKGKASRRGGGGGGGGGNGGGPASQRKVGGSAFVTYGSTLEADTAIMALHGRYNAKEDDNDKDDEAKFLQVSYGQQTGLISAFGAQHAQRLHASKPENPIPLIVLEQGQGTAVERPQLA